MIRLCQSLVLVLSVALASCFGGGIEKKGSVLGYGDGVVRTEGGSFRIGRLPPSWRQVPFRYKAVLFKHATQPAGISVSSFCRGSVDDAPLETLSQQLLYDLSRQQVLSRRTIHLDGREAYRVVKKGYLDGAHVEVDIVTLKMNACVFDFALTTDEAAYRHVVGDFETLFNGFEYVKGPDI